MDPRQQGRASISDVYRMTHPNEEDAFAAARGEIGTGESSPRGSSGSAGGTGSPSPAPLVTEHAARDAGTHDAAADSHPGDRPPAPQFDDDVRLALRFVPEATAIMAFVRDRLPGIHVGVMVLVPGHGVVAVTTDRAVIAPAVAEWVLEVMRPT